MFNLGFNRGLTSDEIGYPWN